MTQRLIIGIDSGISGAIALLGDGDPLRFIDMPSRPRANKGNEINSAELAAIFRGFFSEFQGSFIFSALEKVQSRAGNSASSVWNQAEGFGAIRGVLEAVGIKYKLVAPQTWKRHFDLLLGRDERDTLGMKDAEYKDRSRLKAIDVFQRVITAKELARKKDCGRAEALLIAKWAQDNEAYL